MKYSEKLKHFVGAKGDLKFPSEVNPCMFFRIGEKVPYYAFGQDRIQEVEDDYVVIARGPSESNDIVFVPMNLFILIFQ